MGILFHQAKSAPVGPGMPTERMAAAVAAPEVHPELVGTRKREPEPVAEAPKAKRRRRTRNVLAEPDGAQAAEAPQSNRSLRWAKLTMHANVVAADKSGPCGMLVHPPAAQGSGATPAEGGSVASPPAVDKHLTLKEFAAQSGDRCMRLTLTEYQSTYKTSWGKQQQERILGEGTYGKVTLVKNLCSGTLETCKRFKHQSWDQSAESETCMADVLTTFPHRNLLGTLAIVSQGQDGGKPSMILMQHCDEALSVKFRRHSGKMRDELRHVAFASLNIRQIVVHVRIRVHIIVAHTSQ